MRQSSQPLFFAVRLSVILHYGGQFCLVIAALNLVTLGFALITEEMAVAAIYAAIVLVLFFAGYLLSRVRVDERIQMNEAMVLGCLVFLCVPLIMTLPLLYNGIPFMDALFETISAATTTGLSTLGPIEKLPEIFRFSRAWMQWYGGLGIVVLSLALIVQPGMSALRLSSLEAADDLAGGTKAYARRILIVYAALTAGGLLGWLLMGGKPLEGLLYVLAAVSTGGFAPTSGSFADLPGLRLAWVVSLTCLAGALPLSLYYNAQRKGFRHFLQDMELRALLTACVLITIILGVCFWTQGMMLSDVLVNAPLMTISAQTTSGFSSLDPGTLGPVSKAVLIISMSVGGSIGSTAGGFKLLRLLILAGLLYRSMKRFSSPPDAFVEQRIGQRRVEPAEVQDALMIILAFVGVAFISCLPFLAYGYPPLDVLFEVVSATGTVGLSSGITQAGLPAFLKLVLCGDMLLGRLEFVAWLIFFYHRTWLGRKRGVK